jgi:type III secretory pathway component EscS
MDPIAKTARKMFNLILLVIMLPSALAALTGIIALIALLNNPEAQLHTFIMVCLVVHSTLLVTGFLLAFRLDYWETSQREISSPLGSAVQ